MSESAAASGSKEIPYLIPSDDWELNDFLLDLKENLTDEDFSKMKYLCSGQGGIGKGILESLTSPLDFFTLLRQQERISRDNIILLQALVWRVGRKDIHKKFIEFSREFEGTLHFYAPKNEPENGYKYLKFCVGGNTDGFTKQKLRELQWQVSRLLRVPQHFVYIRGIEPSNSLVITFMIPEDVVEVIEELTNLEKQELQTYGIIYIEMEGTKIDLTEEIKETPVALDIIQENSRLRQEQVQHERDIEKLQMKLIELSKELRAHSNRYSKPGIQTYSTKASKPRYSFQMSIPKPVPSCKVLAAQMLQKRMLRRSRELGYDETTIQLLLEANSVIGREHLATRGNMTIMRLIQNIHSLRNENIWLQYNVDKLKFYRGMNASDKVLSQSDEFFITHLFRLFPVGMGIRAERMVIDPVFVTNKLRQLAKSISKKERKILLTSAQLTKEEEAYINQNPDEILVKIQEKEKRLQRGSINIDEWLAKLLEPLKNQKLLEKALSLFHHQESSTPHRRHKATSKGDQQRRMRATSEGSGTRFKGKPCSSSKEKEHSSLGSDTETVDYDSGFGEVHNSHEDIMSRLNILTDMVYSIKSSLETNGKVDPLDAVTNLHDGEWKSDLLLPESKSQKLLVQEI